MAFAYKGLVLPTVINCYTETFSKNIKKNFTGDIVTYHHNGCCCANRYSSKLASWHRHQ